MIKINARDCAIEEIDLDTEALFLSNNHSQGFVQSAVCYGLYNNGELVQVMSFGRPRFNKNYQWEVIRNCTKKDHIVRGGTSKLWKYFLNAKICNSCICYSYPHNKDLYTDHMVKYCGFTCITRAKKAKKVYFEGIWQGENKRIDKSILEAHGVDRLLGGSFGKERTNEQILLDLGFDKEIEDGYKPQVDIYYPFHVLYRVDDLTDGTFYIGMCESENNWNNEYRGSGKIWNLHMNKHPDHEYRRTILKDDFTDPKELRKAEYNEIKKFCLKCEDGTYVVDFSTGCRNTELRTQGDPFIKKPVKRCPECGGLTFMHKKHCSQYSPVSDCPECGGKINAHKKTCSHYKPPKPCDECGGIFGHKEGCSKYNPPKACEECGSKFAHKKSCSHYKEVEKCPECGGKINAHKKACSKYKEREKCPECGARSPLHFKSCSHYVEAEPCPECGAVRSHLKNCSRATICPECGAGSGTHKKTCSKYNKKPCPECGSTSQHKRTCSKYKKPEVPMCEECGSPITHHKESCSKNTIFIEPCPECGKIRSHSKDCSKAKICPECGGYPGHHKESCSFAFICSECGKPNGKHSTTCSKHKEPCPECGAIIGHKMTCSKCKLCPECGHSPHIKTCSHYKTPAPCPECGGKGNHHLKTCSRHKSNRQQKSNT